MTDDPKRELKVRARLLQRKAAAGEPDALRRLRGSPPLRTLDDRELAATVRRRHCLDLIARERGFADWRHACRLLDGDPDETDYGRALWSQACGGFLNHWFADYAEARAHQDAHGGFLLAFRRDFLVVTPEYVAALGLDPDDPDWQRIGRDWARPRDPGARGRLCARLLAQAPAEGTG